MDFKVNNTREGNRQIDFGSSRTTQGFYQLARRLENILHLTYTQKSDDFNTLKWKCNYQGVPYLLFHHWDSGTLLQLDSKSPSAQDEETLDNIVTLLKEF